MDDGCEEIHNGYRYAKVVMGFYKLQISNILGNFCRKKNNGKKNCVV